MVYIEVTSDEGKYFLEVYRAESDNAPVSVVPIDEKVFNRLNRLIG